MVEEGKNRRVPPGGPFLGAVVRRRVGPGPYLLAREGHRRGTRRRLADGDPGWRRPGGRHHQTAGPDTGSDDDAERATQRVHERPPARERTAPVRTANLRSENDRARARLR